MKNYFRHALKKNARHVFHGERENIHKLESRNSVRLFCLRGRHHGRERDAMIVEGLIVRDAGGEIAPTDRGRAVLRAMLHE